MSFAYVCLGFLYCGGFCIRFAIGCCCLYRLSSVCYRLFSLRSCALALLRSFAGLKRLLLGSEATVLFVGVSCCEPGDGNEQMAHSQIVVVIAFSSSFETDVCLVRHLRPPVFQSPFTILCFVFCFDMACILVVFGICLFTYCFSCLRSLWFY